MKEENEINLELTNDQKLQEQEARDALLNSYLALKDSKDPEDQLLYREVERMFHKKLERFDKQLASLSRGTRRNIKGYSSFSEQFKRRIGL